MTSKAKPRMRQPALETRQALGAFEAAAVMGVHFSTVRRMVEKGMIAARLVPLAGDGQKEAGIYDGRSCEENYLEYEEKLAEGGSGKRPRAHLDLRPDALERLRAIKTPITFLDAITTGEAHQLLDVCQSFITRLIQSGEIVGRRLWSPRGRSGERIWIVSRASCLQNAQKVRRLQAIGQKNGRPRKFS